MKKISIKTTLAGLAPIIAALWHAYSAYTDGNPETAVNVEAVIAAISIGLGLIFARDNSVSSEDAGAKRRNVR